MPLILKLTGNNTGIRILRRVGVKIGSNCLINACHFSTEPYLIEIGDHCAIASGTKFYTHDGGVWCFRSEFPDIDRFGTIKIGNNVFIGANSIILPGTIIEDNCVVGAGSVVRGKIKEKSIIMGNPAQKILNLDVYKMLIMKDRNTFFTKKLTQRQKEKIIKLKMHL